MGKKFKKSVLWLRRDLRLQDNMAAAKASKESDSVQVVFCFDQNIISKLKKEDKRITFIHGALEELNNEINKLGGELVILYGDPKTEIINFFSEGKFDALYFNEDYEPYALRRDNHIKKSLGQKAFSFTDQVIFHPATVRKKDGTPYKVFTPFKNAWLEVLETDRTVLDIKKISSSHWLGKSENFKFSEKNWFKTLEFQKQDLPIATGRKAALEILKSFKKRVRTYEETRNFLEVNSTSGLSPYIRHGLVGIREIIKGTMSDNQFLSSTFLSELIWREFYQMILFSFPQVEKASFKPQYDKINWHNGKKELEAWKTGMTGFPIVDAAMRCLNETGLMPNRLRMVTASFLCKTLLVDWRKGERYFAEKLLDFDLASNSGGWQWSSSSGCDSQPYFRIFNPTAQSERYDPEGKFIKKWCPELAPLSKKDVHEPYKVGPLILESMGVTYPEPVVSYKSNRIKALNMYKEAVK